jgi:hypothetical protein
VFLKPPNIAAAVSIGVLRCMPVESSAAVSQVAGVAENRADREDRLGALRLKAQMHIAAEGALFSALELSDIEARYRSAHLDHPAFVRRPEGLKILLDLIEKYPRSNRAGCAVLELARLSSGPTREQYLRDAVATHSDAWFETGVQVGALARAMLAVHLVGLDRLDEAEQIAEELATMFPGAIDDSGATLDDVLKSIRVLRRDEG